MKVHYVCQCNSVMETDWNACCHFWTHGHFAASLSASSMSLYQPYWVDTNQGTHKQNDYVSGNENKHFSSDHVGTSITCDRSSGGFFVDILTGINLSIFEVSNFNELWDSCWISNVLSVSLLLWELCEIFSDFSVTSLPSTCDTVFSSWWLLMFDDTSGCALSPDLRWWSRFSLGFVPLTGATGVWILLLDLWASGWVTEKLTRYFSKVSHRFGHTI